MGERSASLSPDQRRGWERDGFFLVEGFAPQSTLDAMRQRAVALARAAEAGQSIGDAYVQQEKKLLATSTAPEERVSKIFRLHRGEPVFNAFARDERVLDLIRAILGPDLDCFLSQFIFKLPGALGQPWHQDAFYFPFDREPQVGVWLAITKSTLQNGPLWVLAGSHREPLHEVVRDRREHANFGYFEIIDHDTSNATPALMNPGDLLVFHSHLMHKSTDNEADFERAAMVYHYGQAGTRDHSEEKWGFAPPNVDWMPVRRSCTGAA